MTASLAAALIHSLSGQDWVGVLSVLVQNHCHPSHPSYHRHRMFDQTRSLVKENYRFSIHSDLSLIQDVEVDQLLFGIVYL